MIKNSIPVEELEKNHSVEEVQQEILEKQYTLISINSTGTSESILCRINK